MARLTDFLNEGKKGKGGKDLYKEIQKNPGPKPNVAFGIE